VVVRPALSLSDVVGTDGDGSRATAGAWAPRLAALVLGPASPRKPQANVAHGGLVGNWGGHLNSTAETPELRELQAAGLPAGGKKWWSSAHRSPPARFACGALSHSC